MKLTTLYLDEAEHQLTKLSSLEPGSEEYKAVLANNATLTESIVALRKVELEKAKIAQERKIAAETAKSEKVKERWRNGIAVTSIVAPLAAYTVAVVLSWRIDKCEDALLTATAGKRGLDSLLRILIK